MIIEILSIAFSIASILISGTALLAAHRALIEVEAQKRSTHQIQFVPVDELGKPVAMNDQTFDNLTAEQKQKFTADPYEVL